MTTLTARAFREKLSKLIEQVAESHEPVHIKGKRSNAFFIGEEDWRAIQETLYLLSIPGMGKSIRTGMKTPSKTLVKTLAW